MLRLAVTDGATASFLAGRWAASLANAAIEGDLSTLRDRLELARSGWGDELTRYRAERETAGRPLAWFEEHKLGQGAAAAIVVVELDRGAGVARVASLGDCVAMHLRGDEMLAAEPLDDPSAFDNHPPLLVTTSPVPELAVVEWAVRRGDRLILASDAIAAWLLRRERDGELIEAVAMVCDAGRAFEALVEHERDQGDLVDDDITFVAVDV